MRFRTSDELSEYLRDDLAWRRKENHDMKTMVQLADPGKKQAILRGAIASLYAHWEGFVKTACRAYLEFVKKRRLPHNELSPPLLSLAIRKYLSRIDCSNKLDSHRDFCEWLLAEWLRRANLPDSEEVITTSNLNSEVLRSLIYGLGLPYLTVFQSAEQPVINSLVHQRNNLAHGEWILTDEKEYNQYHKVIDELMEEICKEIETASDTNAYRRSLTQIV